MASSCLSKWFWGCKNPKLMKSEFNQKGYPYSDKLEEIEEDLARGAFDISASLYIRVVTLWVLDSTHYCCSSECKEKHGSLLQNDLFCNPVFQEGARCKEGGGGARRLAQSTPCFSRARWFRACSSSTSWRSQSSWVCRCSTHSSALLAATMRRPDSISNRQSARQANR